MPKWTSNVGLYDIETGNQIGECWLVTVTAQRKSEARDLIRAKAWEEIDSRLDDVRIDIIDGPMKEAEEA